MCTWIDVGVAEACVIGVCVDKGAHVGSIVCAGDNMCVVGMCGCTMCVCVNARVGEGSIVDCMVGNCMRGCCGVHRCRGYCACE